MGGDLLAVMDLHDALGKVDTYFTESDVQQQARSAPKREQAFCFGLYMMGLSTEI